MKLDRNPEIIEEINLTEEEKKAFEIVENVLHTGEIISMSEIPYIRGFLSCLQENWCYTMEINRKGR